MKSFVLFALLISSQISAQWNWAKNISIHHWDYGKHLDRTVNHIFVAGEAGYYGVTPADIFIARYDLNGNLNLLINDTACNLHDFAVDKNENCYALLKLKNTMLLRKYDSIGNISWNKRKNFASIAIHDHFFYASNSTDTITKYDLNGRYISSVITHGISIHKIRTDFHGALYITGHKASDAYIAKVDSIGNIQWEYYGGGTSGTPSQITDFDFDVANNIYVTGQYAAQMHTSCDTLGINSSISGNFTAKFNSTGQCQWIKNKGARNISVTQDGVYLCSYDTMFKYSADGKLLSHLNYPLSPYATSKKTPGSILFTGIFSGRIGLGSNTLASSISTDAYIAKYSPSSANLNAKISGTKLSAFPNPSYGIFQLIYNSEPVEQDICVYDILGNCILTKPITKGGKIDLSHQPKGVYFAEISDKEKKHVAKLVIQ